MGDIMRNREYNRTKVKKRKVGDEDFHDYSPNKRKRKITASEEGVNECMGNTQTLHKQRKRKESESESDWSVRYKSNTELIQRRTESRKGRIEQGTELVIHKKKKKNVKYDDKPNESRATELPTLRRRKVKKKRRGKEKIQKSTAEHSIFEPPPVIERREARGRREEENVDAYSKHTFNPLSVQEGGEEKNSYGGGEREDTVVNKEMSYSYRDKRLPEEERGEKSNSFLNKRKLKERQREDRAEQGAAEKSRLPDHTSCLASNGIYGWETDTSMDNLDYSDDYYHQSPSAIRSRIMQGRKVSLQKCVVYSEGQEVEGFVPDPRYSSDNEDIDWTTVEVSSAHRSSPGLLFKEREIPTLEESLYKFPPGVGVPPEEVGEVQDAENYWIVKENVLQPSGFAEEAKEYIDSKIQYTEDYFQRLQHGQLAPSELKEARPENFDEPFYPTPRQLKFLNSLNIKVSWPLSELHMFHLSTYTVPPKAKAYWHSMNIFADTSRFTLMENKIIARNWFAFQKEYCFWDLRPFVSVRTARLVREAGQLVVQPYEYVSHANKVHFLLYMAKDLPNRTLRHVSRRIQKLLPFLRGRCLLRQSQRMTGLLLAKLLYVMHLFGADMLAAELLIGRSLKSYYSRCFATHIMLRNVKLRVGPWRQDEDERLLRGLKEVLHVGSYEEAYQLRRVPWMTIFPYIRTRSVQYMRRRLIVLASRDGERDNLSAVRSQMARFIRLLYSERVDDFVYLDWEGLARQVGATNPIRLVWAFRRLYFNRVPYSHRKTVPEGLRYMYEHLLAFYEGKKRVNPYRIPQPGDPDCQENHHSDHHLDPTSPNNNLRYEPNSELTDPAVDPSTSSINCTDPISDPCNSFLGSSDPQNLSNNTGSSNEHASPNGDSNDPSIASHNSDNSSMTNSNVVNSNSSKKVNNNDPNYLRNPRITSSNKNDHSNHIKADVPDQGYPVKFSKVSTNHLHNPSNFRKVSSNSDDSRIFKKVFSINQYDLTYLRKHSSSNSKKPRQPSHHPLEGDPSSSVLSNQYDLEKDLNSCDLSDFDDGLRSDSDSDDFETETLGQALSKGGSAMRRQ